MTNTPCTELPGCSQRLLDLTDALAAHSLSPCCIVHIYTDLNSHTSTRITASNLSHLHLLAPDNLLQQLHYIQQTMTVSHVSLPRADLSDTQ